VSQDHSRAGRPPEPGPRRWCAANRLRLGRLTALIVLHACGAQAVHPQPNALEYRVKAAFLYNFTRFVEWPAGTASPSGEPLDLCVLGKNPFGSVLEKTVQGKTVRGQPLRVSAAEDAAELEGCEIIFISSSEKKRMRKILAGIGEHHALTVADTDDFLDWGGMVNFVLEDGTVRFEIDLDRTKEAGIKVSSQLLRVAAAVRTSAAP